MLRFFITLFLFCFISLPVMAEPTSLAKQAVILDYATGQILLEKNSTSKMPTSSMSKIMTTYMVFDALKAGRIKMDSKFIVSEKAWAKGGSKMFVNQGNKVTIEDLLRGVIIQSGNDATIVLAEGLEGSEDAFAKKMTEKAHEIGMTKSNFMNASGWPDPNHYSTAQDLALMAHRIIEDFPKHYKMFAEKEFTYNKITQANRNPLLYKGIGADGLKTGHTEAGGYGLIGTAQKDGRRVLMVINGLESEKDRSEESTKLIQWALNSFKNVKLANKGDKLSEANITLGQTKTVPMIIKTDVHATVPKTTKDSYKLNVRYKSPLIAPIKMGAEIGTFEVLIPNTKPLAYPLYAGESVEKLGFFKLTFEKIKHYIAGKL